MISFEIKDKYEIPKSSGRVVNEIKVDSMDSLLPAIEQEIEGKEYPVELLIITHLDNGYQSIVAERLSSRKEKLDKIIHHLLEVRDRDLLKQ